MAARADVRPARRRRRDDLYAFASAAPAWAWLAALVVVSASIRFDLARGVVAPWIVLDELIYSELAKSFAATGDFLVRGHHRHYGVVYPALISPAWRTFESVPDVYAAAKAINSVVMSLAAIPGYLLARRVLSRWFALLAALLAVAVPSMVYTGMLMTENAFYPLFLCAALALVVYLERPSTARTLAVVAVAGLALATRTQAVALVPAILTAPLILVWFDRRGWRALRDYRSLYAIVAAATGAVLVFEAVRGRTPLAFLHRNDVVSRPDYELGSIVRWFVYHVAELDLYLGIVPVAAFAVLVFEARHLPRPRRAFLAATLALAFWLLLVVATYASQSGHFRIEERYVFYVAPLLLIALLVWVDERAPRPGLVAGVAAVCAAALPGIIPYGRLLKAVAVSDTLALVPWLSVRDSLGVGFTTVHVLVLAGSVAAAAVFLFVPHRYALTSVAVVLVYFAAVQWRLESGSRSIRALSALQLDRGITVEKRDWIDRIAGDEEVTVLWWGLRSIFSVRENEFFNRSVGPVYFLQRPFREPPPRLKLPGEATAWHDERRRYIRDDGGLPIRATYLLTDSTLDFAARRLARDPGTGMALYRVDGVIRTR